MSTSMINTTANPIYSYRASEELNEDSWGTLCNAVEPFLDQPQSIKTQFKDWEKEYKDGTMLPLPGAWRSAKSVINSAVKYGVPLFNEGGQHRGKTAVEQEIKSRKNSDKEHDDPQAKLEQMIGNAKAYADKHELGFFATIKSMYEWSL